MFGIGLPELIVIMGLALIVVGPDKLPGLAKTVAKQVLELKKAANSLKDSLDEELKEEKEELAKIAEPLNEIDVKLPDFDEMHSDDKSTPDLPDSVAFAKEMASGDVSINKVEPVEENSDSVDESDDKKI